MISVFRESGFPVRGARVAGRDRARVPDRAGRRRAAQVRGSRPGRGGRGGRAGAAAALGGGHRRVAAAGLLRRRGVPARPRQRLPRRAATRSTRTRTSSARGGRRRSRSRRRVDLAIVAVPAEAVPGVARECADAGVARAGGDHRGVRRGGRGGRGAARRSCWRSAGRAGCGSSARTAWASSTPTRTSR